VAIPIRVAEHALLRQCVREHFIDIQLDW